MRPLLLSLAAFALAWCSAGCGGTSLDTPEGLPLLVYPKLIPFTLTFTMKSCSDSCQTYDPGSCSVDTNDTRLNFSVSVSYSRRADADTTGCSLTCGPAVYAHCEVPALAAGTYTVVANKFTADITVR